MFKQLIEFIDSHKVLILGFGREGRSTYDIIRRHLPEKEIGIADIREININDPKVTVHSGPNYLDSMKDYQVVIKTPGVSFNDFIIPKDIIITCQTDLFLHFSDCLCVGVTGTKGKTTVSTLIYICLSNPAKACALSETSVFPCLTPLRTANRKLP